METEGAAPAYSTAEVIARLSYGKLVALLASHTRDVAAAEDALSEAFAAALSLWPGDGSPLNPEAWLLTVARRKAIDMARRAAREEPVHEHLQIMEDASGSATIPDRRLALMFACAHPALDAGIRTPLILQVLLGLDAKTIAAAFLTSAEAMGKRLVRAKSKIRQAGVPFRIPEGPELSSRLEAVLNAVYAAFSEGWTDPGGTDAVRRELTTEALFLARLVSELLPQEPEALGLLSLLLHAEARRTARRSPDGEYLPFAEQDLKQWNWPMIEEAEKLLLKAGTLGCPGRFQLEAALQSAHVYRQRSGQANWPDVVELYSALAGLTSSPVVFVNRALAVAERDGAAAGLAALQEVEHDPRLREYQPFWAASADLLARVGAFADARHA